MKILIYSGPFYPKVGGMETTSLILAQQFHLAGNEVKLITVTPGNTNSDRQHFAYEVLRNPSLWKMLILIWECDIFFHKGISLKAFWPIVFFRRKFVVMHETWYSRDHNGKKGWQDQLKLFICRYIVNVAISKSIAQRIPAKSYVIPNPYESRIFTKIEGILRNKELIFLGRIVSDKGVDILLSALFLLKKRNITPVLSIVGEGPEKDSLLFQAKQLKIVDQIQFMGLKKGKELVNILNEHQILVVPSKWPEPFGIVSLEGIACGCVVVGSEQGGLKDAIGSCGVTFPNGNAEKLAETLYLLLTDQTKLLACRNNASFHLKNHSEEHIASLYLTIFKDLVNQN
ncbi:glycosyltransferase family 4 protein [Rhodocytophaga rosea]|uniref:Glycosyltransferase family 4 protein n=1 Tax=Rhodocytophaga rosea TaxID=2704465 RepID=A0A6C0GD08_9BACT|nr:glycosyltransferase family 4 protein [Rhodocytophaga rosea]QHT65768.1 glycosyltransferase family 4 protein [Rhodocytophaga rosea]